MPAISRAVGPWEDRVVLANGGNRQDDILTVQQLLRRASQRLQNEAYDPGTPDGRIARSPGSSSTLNAIEAFQRRWWSSPDRRVDPDGRTFRELVAAAGSAAGGAAPPPPSGRNLRGLTLAPRHNSPGRHDATGAFQPGARTFRNLHGLPDTIIFDNTASASVCRRQVLDAIRDSTGPLQVIAYFGHGTTHSLPSAKIMTRHLSELAEAIRSNSTRDCVVLLYACSAGATGAFASQLATMINTTRPSGGPRRVVYGHTNSGHSFYNPWVTMSPPGELIFERGSPHWRSWTRALRNNDLWAQFPFMTRAELIETLDRT